MRIVFAGTPDFAQRALRALNEAGHDVALVITRPDRAAGRGLRVAESAVKRYARAAGLELFQPASLSGAQPAGRIEAARPDALIVAAYGLLLPRRILDIAPLGAINIHASLLPRWRGAAPIQRALLAGDSETGISIMKMEEGLDTGPVLAQRRLDIEADDDAGTVHDKLAALGAIMIAEALSDLAAGRARPVDQLDSGVTYARKITPGETELDWSKPAVELERVVRALRPSPGARSPCRGEMLKLWRVTCLPESGPAGVVLRSAPAGIVVSCGEGALLIAELQRPGGRRLHASDFLRGFPLGRGDRFGAPC